MQEIVERTAVDSDKQITDMKVRYKSGVLKYKQMGYWVPDYEVKDTDILASLPHYAAGWRRPGRSRRGRRRRSLRQRLGPSCGPTA